MPVIAAALVLAYALAAWWLAMEAMYWLAVGTARNKSR